MNCDNCEHTYKAKLELSPLEKAWAEHQQGCTVSEGEEVRPRLMPAYFGTGYGLGDRDGYTRAIWDELEKEGSP